MECRTPAKQEHWGHEKKAILAPQLSAEHCYMSLGDIRFVPRRWVLAFFLGFLNFSSDVPNFVPLGGGGGYVYTFLESLRKGRFRNVCVGAGGRWTHF